MLRAFEDLHLHPEPLARLLEAVDRFLAEADKSPWSEADKVAAQKRAAEWLARIRKRRAAREALQEQERPAGREPVAPEQFTPQERVALFADLSAEVQGEMDQAAALLVAGEISPNDFQRDMERAIWINARAAFIAGKVALGGAPELSRADERELRRWGNFQVNRLTKFVAEIKAGRLSAAQITARAQLYAGAINAPYNTGQVRAFGDIKLPQVPGDGQTQCRTNCQCLSLIHI